MVDRSPTVREVAESIGAEALETDVTAPVLSARLTDWLGDRSLSHLVTAAGIQVRTPGIDIDEADWAQLVEVNLSCFYRMVRGLHHALRKGDGEHAGSVVAMSSMSANQV